MSDDDRIGLAVSRVADGQPVDWNGLAQRAGADERERLACLQIVGLIAEVHRADHAYSETRADPAPTPSQAPTAEWIGETWGRYKLLAEVGAGSFGRVYRAWDPKLERDIAIKILHSHVADALMDRLLPEARALARLRDPNVVSVLDVEVHGGRIGLCMEFVYGETLEDLLHPNKTLNAREAMLVAQDVCRALAAVHRAGFVHRDVKARNIMREPAGRIVLMDFGAGRSIGEPAGAGRVNVAGTPLYMAPEVLAGEPASERSDVYSVGVLMYHLVSRAYPVEGATLDEIRAAHMLARRTPIGERRSDLPTAFMRAVERALTADPHERCPSAGALLEALAAAGDETFVARETRARMLFRSAAAFAGVAAALTGLGALSSRYFNVALGRAEFAADNVWDWFGWGAKSVVAPAVLFMFALLSVALLVVVRRLLLGASQRARHIDDAVKARLRRSKLDEPANLSSAALLVSATVLTIAWWHFSPLLGALMIYPDISTAPREQLALLSPRFQAEHETYRASFVWVTIICLMAWYAPLRLAAKRREALNGGLLAGGAAVVLLAVLLMDFPYRMLSHNDIFEVAQWHGARCYILGERRDEVLLFCPTLAAPRNRVVSSRAKEIERLGIKENTFSQFSASQ
jgi:hypothetical protein